MGRSLTIAYNFLAVSVFNIKLSFIKLIRKKSFSAFSFICKDFIEIIYLHLTFIFVDGIIIFSLINFEVKLPLFHRFSSKGRFIEISPLEFDDNKVQNVTSKLVDVNEPEQMSIFDFQESFVKENVKDEKHQKLDKALDLIRKKYGDDAIVRGSLKKDK